MSPRGRAGWPELAAVAGLLGSGCRDLSGFTTGPGESYEGTVFDADFVRVGVDAGTSLCLTLNANLLEDAPGLLSTSDGRFHAAPLRPIPQVWHDPLSTFTFGEGRTKNLLYVATATTPFADGNGGDVMTVVSLMQSGAVEVRLLRGAPVAAGDGGPAVSTSAQQNVFAVFSLARKETPCSY